MVQLIYVLLSAYQSPGETSVASPLLLSCHFGIPLPIEHSFNMAKAAKKTKAAKKAATASSKDKGTW
eukprot:scaffold3031_cov136-Skeletonema_menzelii.AAC.6